MRTLVGAGVALVLACGVAAAADEKIDAKKLVGKWESVAGAKKAPRVVVEYTADGKLTGTAALGDMDIKAEGTYKLDGNKLTQTVTMLGKEQTTTVTITKLTDEAMEGETDKGEKHSFKRVKAEKKD